MFFSFDKRILYVILIIMVVMGLMSMTQDTMIGLLMTLPGVLIAITFHEFAHAFVADKLGDDTPRSQGRVSLNPLAHLDPIGSILLLFAHIGWGKPVQINPRNFDRKVSMSAGEAMVSVAGPAMNIILAIVFTIISYLIATLAPSFLFTQTGWIVMTLIEYTVIVNIGLGVFNLIPLPPLDGSKIFMNFMPYNVRNWITDHLQYFYIIFLVIWVTGLASIIVSPVINAIYYGIDWAIGSLFGLFI